MALCKTIFLMRRICKLGVLGNFINFEMSNVIMGKLKRKL